ncbi:MAG TPA: cytochrome c oxidase subunit II [Vicinamibacterales bacterium]|nr:cytochrome c oxidase subunit II [Vicinamibacterales bacterium]
MSSSFPLFPPSASSVSTEMDLLYLFIIAVCAFFTILVTAMVVYFTIRYKRRHPEDVGEPIHGSIVLELTWTIIPLILSLVMFGWGASLFYRLSRPPSDSMEISVVGKQWMWKIQHPEGVREINELHVPAGRNVRITLGSEDVIHDFAIPAFRVKMDAVPGKFTTLWFNATQIGTYHIYCAQYCGTRHSGMIGQVVVMAPQDYEAWLAGGRSTGTSVQNGERLFTDLSCITCHKADSTGRGPSLLGVYDSTVQLGDGRKIVADDNYLRESIMNSQAKVVQGYQPIMPVFQTQISEENLMQLIAYIKSLKTPAQEKK